jgi:phosphoglycerol geranylgeranyltransferase
LKRNVMEYIRERLKHGKLHMTLIDPEKQSPARAAEIASFAERSGSAAIMVGGSTGVDMENTEATLRAMKKVVNIPLICFPSSAASLTSSFDAVFFLSMMNSTAPEHITGEQAAGALLVKKLGIEPIGMGYIIVEPGMRVGEVGRADPVRRNDIARAVGYSLAAEYFGMHLVYLEAGSGAPFHVPEEMIRSVKREISIPLIVGGGIRTAEAARRVAESGADIIVTGTIAEEDSSLRSLAEIVASITGRSHYTH